MSSHTLVLPLPLAGGARGSVKAARRSPLSRIRAEVLLLPLLLAVLVWAASTVSFSVHVANEGAGSVAYFAGRSIALTTTLDLSQPPQIYQRQPAVGYYHPQVSGLLGWLSELNPRPGLTWQTVYSRGGVLSGFGLANGSNDQQAGLIFLGSDRQAYLLAVEPARSSVAWYAAAEPIPAARLQASNYRPTFDQALLTLLGEIALNLLYALGVLGLGLLLGWLFRRIASRLTSPAKPAGYVATSEATSLPPRFLSNRLLIPGLIFTFTLLTTGYVAYNVLAGVPHVQDSAAYIFQSRIFADRRLLVPDPGAVLHEPLEHAYVLFYNGAWFSKYPPGYPLLLAIGTLFGQPAIIDPLCAALALVFVYLAAKELYGRAIGLLAAGLGLTSPFLLTMSGAILSHSLGLLCTAAFLFFFIRSARSTIYNLRSTIYNLLAGLSIGWLAITRELTAVGIALPFVVYALVELGRRRDWPTLRRYLLMTAGALPPLIFLLVDNAVLTGSPFMFPHDLRADFDRLGFGPGIGGTLEGHTPTLGLANITIYLRTMANVLFGWPAPFTFTFVLLGAFLPERLLAPNKRDLPATSTAASNSTRSTIYNLQSTILLAPIISLTGAYFFWWAAARVFGPRYWYEMLPFLCTLTAVGVVKLGRLVAEKWIVDSEKKGRELAGYIPVGLLLAVLVGYNLTAYLPGYVDDYRGYNGITGGEQAVVQRAGLQRAVIFVALDPSAPRRDYSKVFWLNDPLLDKAGDTVIYLRDLGPTANAAAAAHFPGWPVYRLDGDELTVVSSQ